MTKKNNKKEPKEKPYNDGQWTQARFNSFIKSALRKASTRWPPGYGALNDAFVGSAINPESGRMCKHYKCAVCGESFPAKRVAKDHIVPVIDPRKGWQNWTEYITRLFCDVDCFQIICAEDHDAKTARERKVRLRYKRIKKEAA